MHPAANILIAQSHHEDLRRAAAASVRRAEARRAAAEALNPRRTDRDLVLRGSRFRRLAGRLAV